MDERFMLLKCLNEGGAANIFLATDGHKIYVIKKSLPNIRARQQCRQEWLICQHLAPHDNILSITEAWYSTHQPVDFTDDFQWDIFLLMGYAKINLYDYNNKHILPLPLSTTVKIVTGIAQGLAHLHKNNIIHRDIKPENILLKDGIPKIIDFGYAVHVPITEDRIVGTAEYIAPEVYTCSHYTTYVDMHALGVILYELLTKFTPYHGTTLPDVQANVIINNRKYDHLLPHNESIKLLIDSLIFKPFVISKPSLRLTATEVIDYNYQI